eukprot:CAMPEP_0113639268 /NCGR_PEP_ID=MMETSP0017_2-20120614/20596_1 /TAXON_ID=2856 /ORGANISM="Cylindrotheca closterium" /LENGTH=743 /DNA_ID=CAMNT_0000550465 /DNA_START=82 /DNA_END=2313 /DNA_ORIENTATION=+ /assembly_acc=CAM_ASM_000147
MPTESTATTTEPVKDDIESSEQPSCSTTDTATLKEDKLETPEPPLPPKDSETSETLETPTVEEKLEDEEKPKEETTTVEPTNEEEVKKDVEMSEGVEVVLDAGNGSTIVDQDQNVFRAPNPVRPRAMRAPHPHDVKGSGSYGYGAPADYHQSPYPYAPSTSFDEGGYPPMTASHYSPHVQYPHPTRHGGDVNVISPSHKEHAPSSHRPPMTPSRRGGHHSYQYPPSSPVSRGGPTGHHSPPRMRGYHMRRPEGQGPYSAAVRSRSHPPTRHPEEDAWGYSPEQRPRPPIVAEASFDSEHYPSHASHASNPTTPNAPHYGPPMHHESGGGYHHQHHQQQGFQGGSFGSFESPAPGYYEQRGHYGRPSPHHPHESPYTPYSHGHGYPGYSPGGYPRDYYSPHADYHRRYAHSYDDEYGHGSKKNDSGMMLPKAAQEIDFEVTDPPMEPIIGPSKTPMCESPADVNSYDVLCGRGGGTNSQIGNRRFRKLVQEFQPTYLLARRKEKPLLARTIVLIIRKRGGRFLKKDDETGELYEVGDVKAEAKTSQALREGLDVRATKSAASNLMDKKKKKKTTSSPMKEEEKETAADVMSPSQTDSPAGVTEMKSGGRKSAEAPPSLPTLNQDQPAPPPSPPSPNSVHFRKRRRMRSGDASVGAGAGCGMGFQDKLFPDFCPPRADLGRVASPTMEMAMDMSHSRHEMKFEDDIYAHGPPPPQQQRAGCGGIAFDIVTGAAASSFCLGPRKWR